MKICLAAVFNVSSRTALLERNSIRHEQYEKQQQDTFLVQRSPYLNIQMGRLGEKMRQYQLPYNNVLPVPLFMPCKLPVQHSPAEEWKSPTMDRQTAMSNGYATAKREVEQIKKDLPKLIQPAKLDFQVSSLVSRPHMALQPML